MAERGYVLLYYDAPDDEAFQRWLHGPHFDDVIAQTPGVYAITRLEVLEPGPGERRYIALIATDDLAATLAWRAGPGGQALRADAVAHGAHNHRAVAARVVYDTGQH